MICDAMTSGTMTRGVVTSGGGAHGSIDGVTEEELSEGETCGEREGKDGPSPMRTRPLRRRGRLAQRAGELVADAGSSRSVGAKRVARHGRLA